jgi:hypothetical protein
MGWFHETKRIQIEMTSFSLFLKKLVQWIKNNKVIRNIVSSISNLFTKTSPEWKTSIDERLRNSLIKSSTTLTSRAENNTNGN